MALVLKDRVKETCTGTSGDMALAGAVSGFVAFDADATFDSNTTYYTLEDADGTKWEVGIGTLSADSTTLTRTTILATQASFTDTTRQTFSGGTHTIFCGYPAGKSVHLDASGDLTVAGTLTTNSGIVRKVATKVDTNYTMTASDHIVLVDTTDANRTITLPAASADNEGQEYTIKKIDSGTGVVNIIPATVSGYGADDIDEYNTKYVLWVQHDSVTFVCGPGDATAADEQWWITSEKVAPHTCMMTMEGASGTFGDNTPHKVLFDASKHDMGASGSDANMLTTAGADARITIKRPGRYSITSQILFNNTLDAAEHFRIDIYINGAQTFGGSSYPSTTTDQYVYGAVDKTLELSVGDYIQIYFYHNDAADDAEIYNKAEDGSSRTIWDPFVAVNEVSK
tara:strand:- start:12120 stop:13313 length:1194 start_codon:yes stop_codon:yes gene_type:complete